MMFLCVRRSDDSTLFSPATPRNNNNRERESDREKESNAHSVGLHLVTDAHITEHGRRNASEPDLHPAMYHITSMPLLKEGGGPCELMK